MNVSVNIVKFLFVFGFAFLSAQDHDQSQYSVGFRANIMLGTGEPANDIPGFGLFGRYQFRQNWRLEVAVDHYDGFDFERPWHLVGLQQDPNVATIDTTVTTTNFSLSIERVFLKPGRLDWYLGLGVGLNSPDIANVTGPTQDGGTFDLVSDGGSETVIMGKAGCTLKFGKRWGFDFHLALDHHLCEWEVTDRISGTTATLKDFSAKGGRFGLVYHF